MSRNKISLALLTVYIVLFIMFIIIGSIGCGQTNVQNKPVKVEGSVEVNHNVKIDSSKLIELYSTECKQEINRSDYGDQQSYDAAIKECSELKVIKFYDTIEAVSK